MIIKNIPRTITTNVYRNTHHFKLNSLKSDFHDDLFYHLKEQKIDFRPLSVPCIIEFTFRYKNGNCKRDLDGDYPSVKFTLDSLVSMGFLKDDDRDNISGINFRDGGKGDNTFDIEIFSV